MQPYEVIKAETLEEAVAKSQWGVGQLARCSDVQAVSNSDGTWSVFATFELVEE